VGIAIPRARLQEQVRVDHLVQQRVHQIRSRTQLQERLRQSHAAVAAVLVVAHAGTQRHFLGKFAFHASKRVPEEVGVKLLEKRAHIRVWI
jgi:hypothetical protein